MKRLITTLCTIALGLVIRADDRDWAIRIPCEMQTAGSASLPRLTLLQGSSPLISADQYRSGKALTATNDVNAILRFSQSATNTLWVSVTNYATAGNGYLIQLPSLGTNATSWVYTILYERDGATYWTGNGRLDITASTVAGNALVWQEVTGAVTTNTVNALIATHNTNLTAHATLLSSYVTQAMTNGWTVSAHLDWLLRSETNGWVVSSHDSFLTAETDPSWNADKASYATTASLSGYVPTNDTRYLTAIDASTATNITRNVEGWQTFTDLTGSIIITNQYEAPISISGTGSVSVSFSGLRVPYPVYFTAQGFSSLTFPASSYLVGGGSWQTNRVNHFVIWQYSTNLYINPVITSEVE